jgi:predicted Zn-ribbon and HTH transcriptional regulator
MDDLECMDCGWTAPAFVKPVRCPNCGSDNIATHEQIAEYLIEEALSVPSGKGDE